MSFKVEEKEELFIIDCEENLVGRNCPRLMPIVQATVEKAQLKKTSAIVFDFKGKATIDHNCFRELTPLAFSLKQQGKSFFAVNVPKEIARFISASGMERIIQIAVSAESVLELIRASAKPAGGGAAAKPAAAAPKVDVNFINPFVTATVRTLNLQCSTEVRPGKPYLKKQDTPASMTTDIAGVIGLTSKNFNGSISICYPAATFLALMSKMLGEEFKILSDELVDGAGELLNIIFGQAKIMLNEKGYGIEKAIPTVIRATDLKVRHLTAGPIVVLPFESTCGPFQIEVGIASG